MKLTRWMPDWLVNRVMHDYNENPPMPQQPAAKQEGHA
jgi:hypothetical protein